MEAIAKSAGVAKGTIYLYFKNKEEIIFAIWDMITQIHQKSYMKNITDEMSAREKILLYFNFEECETHEDKEQILILLQNFISAMLVDKTGLYGKYFESFFEQDFDFLSACLHEGVQKGEFQSEDIEILTTSIILIFKGLAVHVKASNLGFFEAQKLLLQYINSLLDHYTRRLS
jgi:TetR/AcrR family acrAB operon transcriptional repressor